jgi:glycine/D-amino acid oxidase-like deaminating enzyme
VKDTGYSATGSLIISPNRAGATALEQRTKDLESAGIHAELLSPRECMHAEPLLHLPADGAGLRVASDFQIDAVAASNHLLKCCKQLSGPQNRFNIEFGCMAEKIGMDCCTGDASGVMTNKGDFRCACVIDASSIGGLLSLIYSVQGHPTSS